MINSVITIDPEIQSGSPVFTGTRVPVKSFFDYISNGETIEAYLEDYPYITKEQMYALHKTRYALTGWTVIYL